MNTSTTSTFNPRVVALSIFVALASTSSLVCSASEPGDSLQVKVKYADINVSSAQGATTLYNRIHMAAESVCKPLISRDLAFKRLSDTCIHNAMAAAVKDVGQPALSAVYNAKTEVSKPIVLASSQTR
jgi:UrcA family protein